MLKQVYVRMAQAMPMLVPGGAARYALRTGKPISAGQCWLLSLGAIYHLDRMIALDIPWWNVAATGDVEAFLSRRPQARVFEYGSGASTVWLARRAGSVSSVEHDSGWAGQLAPKLAGYPHVSLTVAGFDPLGVADEQAYVRSIDGTGLYDLIVVDGRLRAACLSRALSHLQPDGIVVFDDSGRRRYRDTIEQCGLRETHYHGLSYCVPYPDHTSVLASGPWP